MTSPSESHRIDLPIELARDPDTDALALRLDEGRAVPLPAEAIGPDTTPDQLLAHLRANGLDDHLVGFRERAAAALRSFGPRSIARLAIDAADPSLASAPWERALAKVRGTDEVIVRVSPVWPRALGAPLVPPVRVLFVDTPRDHPVASALRHRAPALVTDLVASTDLSARQSLWPTAEALVFHGPPWPRAPLLSTASPSQTGTLAWLARLTERWQTRLLVLLTGLPDPALDHAAATRLAAALVARGGPAVLVADVASTATAALLRAIASDEPLDHALRTVTAAAGDACLFVGAGREEILRIAFAAQSFLTPLVEEALTRDEGLSAVTVSGLRKAAASTPFESADDAAGIGPDEPASPPPERLTPKGLPPLPFTFSAPAAAPSPLERYHHAVQVAGAERRKSGHESATHLTRRFTNTLLHDIERDGSLRPLDAATEHVRAGRTYQLAVQIGRRSKALRVVGSNALLEEAFRWVAEDDGAWLEVAITGIDFDVLGDPVQELWLPRQGATEAIHFAVRPRAPLPTTGSPAPADPGASRLRVCLYHRGALVQSLRLVTLVALEDGQSAVPEELRRARLADALDLPFLPEKWSDKGYLVRVEYGSLPASDPLPERPPRALSITANHAGDQSVFTIKGADCFTVAKDPNVPEYVKNVRRVLTEISQTVVTKGAASLTRYGFADDNTGPESKLRAALVELARHGHQIYTGILARKERDAVAPLLEGAERTIQVAHLRLDEVVPWAVLYDRVVDSPARPENVCLAACKSGRFDRPCGDDPACLLSATSQAERAARSAPPLTKREVVCPTRFWGFRHHVELPLLHAPIDPEATPRDAQPVDVVRCARPAKVVAGLHLGLPRADRHVDAMKKLFTEAGATLASAPSTRGAILDALDDETIDVAYFYCRTQTRNEKDDYEPALCFQAPGDPHVERITAPDLAEGAIFRHNPLVVLNGCSTAGLLPNVPSPFLLALVRDRRAAGVLGTEVDVWEQLAGEMARLFLGKFMAGMKAGDALLAARRALLARGNPLGLVYTLYASADLQLASPA